MNVICSICSDQLTQSDDIFYTRCGHVFHLQCLNPWLERSKSCPQCREKVTESKIHRLYFTFASNEIADSQASSLQERIDSLKFKILLKEKDIQHYTSKCVTLEKQNAGLRQEVYKVEAELNQKNAAIHALKEQIEYFKKRSSHCDNLKKEIAQLKSKLEDLKPIQVLLHAPLSNVNKLIGNSKDPETLIKYISIMKKELHESFNKCKQLRMTIKRLKDKLNIVNTKLNSLLEPSKQIDSEEELPLTDNKNVTLEKTDDELEEVHDIDDKCSNVSEVQKITSKSNTFKNQPVEVKIKKDKSNKETLGKYVIPVKRKMIKMTISKSRNEDRTECKTHSIQLESDTSSSETDITSYNSAKDSPTVSKRFKMSDDDTNTSDNNTNKSTSNSILKKKKKHQTREKLFDIEDQDDSSVIDLT